MAFYCLGLMLGRSDTEAAQPAPSRQTSKKPKTDQSDPLSQLDFINSSVDGGGGSVASKPQPKDSVVVSGGVKSAPVEKAKTAHSVLTVQVGAFEKKRDAQKVADELFRRGYGTRIVPPSDSRNDSKFRIYVGSYPDRARAEAVVRELRKLGYQAHAND
jgi:cell division protein FtsN